MLKIACLPPVFRGWQDSGHFSGFTQNSLTAWSVCNKIPNTMQTQHDFKEKKIRQLEEQCRRNGLAITVQRRVIIEALAERRDHPSADQLYDTVRGRVRGISRTTVYRVLETLEGIGVVQKVSNPEARARFDADTARHHHLYCTHCQKIQDVSDPALELLPLPSEGYGGFAIAGFSITFSGVCPDCRTVQSQSP